MIYLLTHRIIPGQTLHPARQGRQGLSAVRLQTAQGPPGGPLQGGLGEKFLDRRGGSVGWASRGGNGSGCLDASVASDLLLFLWFQFVAGLCVFIEVIRKLLHPVYGYYFVRPLRDPRLIGVRPKKIFRGSV